MQAQVCIEALADIQALVEVCKQAQLAEIEIHQIRS